MSDHCEEQEMEAEALQAIFDTAFEAISSSFPGIEWSIKLLPVDCGRDESDDEEEDQNFVAIKLFAKLPMDYPELSLPELNIQIIKGLTEEHRIQLLEMANEEAKNNEGMPAIYAIAEVLREWLADNNQPGLDDASMHAQMIRKQKDQAKQKEALVARDYIESQKKHYDISEAETEEQQVRKRREEGTPCNKENFERWRDAFAKEMEEKIILDEAAALGDATKKKKVLMEKKEDKAGRITGFAHFSGKTLNLEALERAAEEAEAQEVTESEFGEVDEELFDNDEDLDDLDFDSNDDDDEDEPDIWIIGATKLALVLVFFGESERSGQKT